MVIPLGIPLRLKAIHIVNLPSIANAFLKVGVSAMGQKMQKRVFLHKSQIEFQNAFDTPEILPLEYGGTISTDDMVTELKKNLNNERIRILNGDNQEIEIIKESGDWLRSGDKNLGLAGSFRKLEID